MNVIDIIKPGQIQIQTSIYADFIPDDHYLPAPEPRVVLVNQKTYDKIKSMTHAEFQYFIGELRDFSQVEKERMRDDHGW